MKNTGLVRFIVAPLMVLAFSLPAWAADSTAATNCKDGTTSTATGRGACSGHGGVQKASKSAPAAPATAAAPAAAAAPPVAAAPTGATAKCKDGTYSKSQHHSGTCSKHGGVAEWLTATK
jgi:hypothetical protein